MYLIVINEYVLIGGFSIVRAVYGMCRWQLYALSLTKAGDKNKSQDVLISEIPIVADTLSRFVKTLNWTTLLVCLSIRSAFVIQTK